MRIVVDVMGFENKSSYAIKACDKFAKKHEDVQFVLVGDKVSIEKYNVNNFEIIDAKEFLTMEATPITALRNKNTSMHKAFSYLKEDKADVLVSAGNTNCFVSLAYMIIGVAKGVTKPGFMVYLPTVDGKGMMMLDVGANKEMSGEEIYNLAKLGNEYSKKVRKINKPRLGLINIGTEENKGLEYHDVANKLISKDKKINYSGFVETRNLIFGGTDIAVCDGYTGNIALKAYEGGLKSVSKILKEYYKKPINILILFLFVLIPIFWPAILFFMAPLKKITNTFDYKNNAGAIVLGLNKPVVKTHGSADQKQFYSSIRLAYETVNSKFMKETKK